MIGSGKRKMRLKEIQKRHKTILFEPCTDGDSYETALQINNKEEKQ